MPDPPPSYVPPILLEEPQRPPLVPQPAINQNIHPARTEPDFDEIARPTRASRRAIVPDDEPEPPRLPKIVAWVILAPWYGLVFALAVGIIGLFVKNLLGL